MRACADEATARRAADRQSIRTLAFYIRTWITQTEKHAEFANSKSPCAWAGPSTADQEKDALLQQNTENRNSIASRVISLHVCAFAQVERLQTENRRHASNRTAVEQLFNQKLDLSNSERDMLAMQLAQAYEEIAVRDASLADSAAYMQVRKSFYACLHTKHAFNVACTGVHGSCSEGRISCRLCILHSGVSTKLSTSLKSFAEGGICSCCASCKDT